MRLIVTDVEDVPDLEGVSEGLVDAVVVAVLLPVPERVVDAVAPATCTSHARLRSLHAAPPAHTGGAARRVQEAPAVGAGHHDALPPVLLPPPLLPHSACENAAAAAPRTDTPVAPPPCRTVHAAIGAQAAGEAPWQRSSSGSHDRPATHTVANSGVVRGGALLPPCCAARATTYAAAHAGAGPMPSAAAMPR